MIKWNWTNNLFGWIFNTEEIFLIHQFPHCIIFYSIVKSLQIYNSSSATLLFLSLEMLKISAVSAPIRQQKQEFFAKLCFVSIYVLTALAVPHAAHAAVHTTGKLSVSDLGAAT